MTPVDRDSVRELIEQARELRRREQPPPELVAASLGHLARAELTRESSRSLGLSGRRSGSLPSLLRLAPLLRRAPLRLGLALVLALAVIVIGRARRHTALEPHQNVPSVALVPEPASLPEAARAPEPGDTGQPQAPAPAPLPAAPAPASAAAAAAEKHPRTKQDGKKRPAPRGGTKKPAAPPERSCDPPWYIDAQGLKRLKENCY